MRTGGRKHLMQHRLIFTSKCEDEEVVMLGVIYAAAKQ
jgi:hypothetical protein